MRSIVGSSGPVPGNVARAPAADAVGLFELMTLHPGARRAFNHRQPIRAKPAITPSGHEVRMWNVESYSSTAAHGAHNEARRRPGLTSLAASANSLKAKDENHDTGIRADDR
jgi:hypothetical protein